MEDYENLASDLLDWINKKIPEFEDRTTDNSLANMQVNTHYQPALTGLAVLFGFTFFLPSQFVCDLRSNSCFFLGSCYQELDL